MVAKDRVADYPIDIVQRAERALGCSAFTIELLADMAKEGVPLKSIAQEGSTNSYLSHPIDLAIAENSLLWLVQVGILRREVDGQGITDSFRLTPMGHYLLEKWQTQGRFPIPSSIDRIQNFLAQWQPARFF